MTKEDKQKKAWHELSDESRRYMCELFNHYNDEGMSSFDKEYSEELRGSINALKEAFGRDNLVEGTELYVPDVEIKEDEIIYASDELIPDRSKWKKCHFITTTADNKIFTSEGVYKYFITELMYNHMTGRNIILLAFEVRNRLLKQIKILD